MSATKVCLEVGIVFLKSRIAVVVLIVGVVAEAQGFSRVCIVGTEEAIATYEVGSAQSEVPRPTQLIRGRSILRGADLTELPSLCAWKSIFIV